MSAVIIIALLIAVLVGGPMLLIWSLNTLFPALAIPFGLPTWFAALVVMVLLGRGNSSGSSKK